MALHPELATPTNPLLPISAQCCQPCFEWDCSSAFHPIAQFFKINLESRSLLG